MNPLIQVDVTLYFKVSNSKVFGGEGTEGYSVVKLDEVKNLEGVDEELIRMQKVALAKLLKVRVEDIELVSKEEYDRETADEEEAG